MKNLTTKEENNRQSFSDEIFPLLCECACVWVSVHAFTRALSKIIGSMQCFPDNLRYKWQMENEKEKKQGEKRIWRSESGNEKRNKRQTTSPLLHHWTKLIAHEKRSRAIRPNYRTKQQQQNKTNTKLDERARARAGARRERSRRRKQQIISRQSKSRAYTKASSVH